MARCKICRSPFERRSMTHKTCSPPCAEEFVKRERGKRLEQAARQERKSLRDQKEKLKTLSDYKREAQTAFNAWIRWRDRDLPCICCDVPLNSGGVGGGFDAGHYRSVGSAPHLRFDERNVHGQSKKCNRYGGGRAVDYRRGLIKRIGLAEVEALEADQSVKKFTIEDLKRIKADYTKRLREAKRGA